VIVMGGPGSGLSRRVRDRPGARCCTGLETGTDPYEPFLQFTAGQSTGDPVSMAALVSKALDGSDLVVDDAQWLDSPALDVVAELAGRHSVVLGVHPGEGRWTDVVARFPSATISTSDPVDAGVIDRIVVGVADEEQRSSIVERAGRSPGLASALAMGGPVAASMNDRFRSLAAALPPPADNWLVDAALVPRPSAADLSARIGPPPAVLRDWGLVDDADVVVCPALLDAVIETLDPMQRATRQMQLAKRIVDDPVMTASLLIQAGDTDSARRAAAEGLAASTDPDERATLAGLAADGDPSLLTAAEMLLARERPVEADALLTRLVDSDAAAAVTTRAATARQLDDPARWVFVDRLPAGKERDRQVAWSRGDLDQPGYPAPEHPIAVTDLDAARWAWQVAAARSFAESRDLLGTVDALDHDDLTASWRQLVRHLRGLEALHREGASRHVVDELDRTTVPALPGVVLDAHRAVALADLGDTAVALETATAIGVLVPTERVIAGWAIAEAELAAGHPVAALRVAAALQDVDHRLLVTVGLVAAWAAWDVDEDNPLRHTSLRDDSEAAQEMLAIDHARAGRYLDAVRTFDESAERWRSWHRRGDLRCQFGAGEALRAAGEIGAAIERLTPVEAACVEAGYGPLLQRVRRSLRLAGVRRTGRRSANAGPLSAREAEVIDLVGKGLTTRDIATRLGVATATVETQITAAMNKLGAKTRLQAALAYREMNS
jgi:DNA-binding CsgD family transcriptional regulator